MPIYSYRCENCGHQQDVLQKMSDPLLVDCPSCGKPAYRKQVTAAGFQLKGSGWYVTDFKNPAVKDASKAAPKPEGEPAAKDGTQDATTPSTTANGPAGATPSAAPAPAPAAGDSKSDASSSKKPAAPSSGSP